VSNAVTSRIRATLTVRASLLSTGEAERTHARALEALEKMSIKFGSQKALGLLADAGCEIDRQERSARIPARLVEKAL
jgi:trimethylamine:corrinoid methyltransferase-like protein